MRIESPAPIRRPLPLTPLVDVVFLLLMFFMLSSTFTRFGDLNLSSGDAAKKWGSQQSKSEIPGVIISLAKGPKIKINGVITSVDQITSVLNDYSEKGVRSGAIMLIGSAEVQDLVTVLERARASRIHSIAVTR